MSLKAYISGSTYLSSITVLRNSYGTSIHLQALDSNGTAVNLTGNTSITFNVRLLGSSTNQVSSTTVPVDTAASGLCHYVPVAADFNTEGVYYAELIIAYASSSVRVTDLIIVVISEGSPTQNMYCSKTDVEGYLQITGEYTDATSPTVSQVNTFIARATANINLAAGHDFLPHTITQLYDACGGHRAGLIEIKSSHLPLVTLTSVQYWNGAAGWVTANQGQPDDPANAGFSTYYYYPNEGIIKFNGIRLVRNQGYRATYTYGYGSVPDDVIGLCTRMAALDVLLTQAAGTISQFNVATLRITYAGGWELGQQEEMMMRGINRDLRTLRRFFVGMG